MTGYGKAFSDNEKIKIIVDIKSINSKQLDMTLRLPAIFREQETILRNLLSPMLERGKVEVNVSYENHLGKAPVKINKEILGDYQHQLLEICEELDISKPEDWFSVLLRLPDVMASETPEADETENQMLANAVVSAANELTISRIKEGKGLYEFFIDKIERIQKYLSMTEKYEIGRVEKIREKLELQLSRLQGVDVDQGRLEQELIFYIEKLDVTEEKQRLSSHLEYFLETLGEPDAEYVSGKGKKLGFISQEMGREINTLGSKSNDAEMQRLVVMMKDELEQIKEQVLNVL